MVRGDGVKITAYYKSGAHQVFIVPSEIHVTEFQRMAEKVGGEILKIEFASIGLKTRQYHIEEGNL